MKEITVTFSDKEYDAVMTEVYRTNVDRGLHLTIEEWVAMYAIELAINREMAGNLEAIREQAEKEANDTLQARVAAEQQRLLDDLKD